MKKRGKIELAPGSVLPTKRSQWGSSEAKLDEAKAAISVMGSSQDRLTIEDAWSNFVDALAESWSSFFDEGKAISSKFQPWAGPLDKSRTKDPLLSYLKNARNRSQHGNFRLDWTATRTQYAPGFTGTIQGLKGYSDGTYEFVAEPDAPGGEKDLRIVHRGGDAVLPTFVNRGVSYAPPTTHNGLPIKVPSPVEAARFGVEYYESVFSSAKKKFGA